MGNKKIKLYKKKSNGQNNKKWLFMIIIWTLVISFSINTLTEWIIPNVNLISAIAILLFIIFIGIFFDIIGVAVTAADEVPFHSLASRKINGAKLAVRLIRNADKVSNFCNDVIGDIVGIISGATGAVIASNISSLYTSLNKTFLALTISSIIATLTIGGKALGKNFAFVQANNIVFYISRFLEKFIKIKKSKRGKGDGYNRKSKLS
ncbi:hypothetical protein SAMN05660865_01116 [Caloramator fervidus]|uniref:CNNM transmembrane domain-containing protein n=1 Tax=Caloramator fervidus TaxID=29344 RepID=A0A1H5V7N9_9CLOT|nr:hypothetical protein [Caloramator fervidus]SEF82457.1 hypothetical protein SAMN05660865_01116 [Caloramator fervidus]